MSKKRSSRISFIIALFFTLGVFFVTYISIYWSYLNNEFLDANELRYKEISNNLASSFQSKISIVEHDIDGLLEYLSEYATQEDRFIDEFKRRTSTILRKEDSYKGFFLVMEPSYSVNLISAIQQDNFFDEEKRFNIYLNKSDFGGLRLSNYSDYASSQITEKYDELIESPGKHVIFPVVRDGHKVLVFLFPTYYKGRPVGILGVEMKTEIFQEKLKLFYEKDINTSTILVSTEGNIIALSPVENNTFIGLRVSEVFDKLPTGSIIDRKDTIIDVGDRILIETPVLTTNIAFPWQLKLIFHKRVYKGLTFRILLLNTSLAVLALIALILVFNYLFKAYSLEIRNLLRFGQRLEFGLLEKETKKYRTEEFGQLGEYFNKIIDFELSLTEYLELIYERDYSHDMKLRSKNDVLVKSLNRLVGRLSKSRSEAEQQAKEVVERNWGRKALADFANILSSADKSLEELSSATLRKFSDIFGLVIGAIYVKEDELQDEYNLRLVSAFALDHDKKNEKIIQYGEGFVGATAIEQKPLFVDKVPENYLEISTGLGRAKPRFLIFVPLIYEQNTVGVLELATLKEISEFEKQFVVNVAENIAIALSGVLVTKRTTGLLEQSEKQAQMLQVREEELQRNIAELKDLQEQSEKTNFKLEAITQSIDFNFYSFALDIKERILDVNSYFVEDFKIETADLIGKSFDKISSLVDNREYFTNLWRDLKKGIVRRESEIFIFNETKRNVISFYTPIKDARTQEVSSVYLFALDVTAHEETRELLTISKFELDKFEQRTEKELSEIKELNRRFRGAHKDLLRIVEAIDQRIIRVEYNVDGSLIKANSLYYKMMGYASGENIEGIENMILSNNEVKARWDKVIKGNINEVLTLVKSKSGKEYWWNVIDIPINNRMGNVIKVMSIAIDITKEKMSEIKIRDAMTNEAIQRKKLQQKVAEMETKVNILSEENQVKEELIKKLKNDIRKYRN